MVDVARENPESPQRESGPDQFGLLVSRCQAVQARHTRRARNSRTMSLVNIRAAPIASAQRTGRPGKPAPASSRADVAGIGRRDALARAATIAARKLLPGTIVLPAAPNAFADPVADPVDLAPFVGKAGFFIRYPAGWVRATDRPGTDNGKSETLALVGNFKDIDTVSVRREPMALHRDFAEAAAEGGGGGEDASSSTSDDTSPSTSSSTSDTMARRVALALTAAERDAVAANQNFGVVGGVENGRSGVMDFALGNASVANRPGASKGTTQPYFAYEYFTEVCRANIEEGAGGAKVCVGPRGDVLDTVRRVNYAVATESEGYLYLVKASAVEGRWETVGPLLREVAESFRVPQAY